MKNYILDKTLAAKKIERMALEIVEQNTDAEEILLAGINGNGLTIAKKLCALLTLIFTGTIKVVEILLDKRNPGAVVLQPETNPDNKVVVIVDDVVNSGKTMAYALKPFLQVHPQKIQTLVLVERTHKMFPIHSDYVGLSVATTMQEHIYVEIADGEVSGAWME